MHAGPEASLSETLASGRTLPHLPLNSLSWGALVQQEPSHEPSQEPAPEEVHPEAELRLLSMTRDILALLSNCLCNESRLHHDYKAWGKTLLPWTGNQAFWQSTAIWPICCTTAAHRSSHMPLAELENCFSAAESAKVCIEGLSLLTTTMS